MGREALWQLFPLAAGDEYKQDAFQAGPSGVRRPSAEGTAFEFGDVRTEPFPLSVREIRVLGEVDLPCGSHERNPFRSDRYATS